MRVHRRHTLTHTCTNTSIASGTNCKECTALTYVSVIPRQTQTHFCFIILNWTVDQWRNDGRTVRGEEKYQSIKWSVCWCILCIFRSYTKSTNSTHAHDINTNITHSGYTVHTLTHTNACILVNYVPTKLNIFTLYFLYTQNLKQYLSNTLVTSCALVFLRAKVRVLDARMCAMCWLGDKLNVMGNLWRWHAGVCIRKTPVVALCGCVCVLTHSIHFLYALERPTQSQRRLESSVSLIGYHFELFY